MADASESDRQRIIRALEKGGIEYAPIGQRYFDRAGVIKGGKDADWTVVEAEITHVSGPWEEKGTDGNLRGNKGWIEVSWATESAGFGILAFGITRDGKLVADTEGMDKDFCKDVLAKLVDSWEDRNG